MRDWARQSFEIGGWAQSKEDLHLSHLLVTVRQTPNPISCCLSALPERRTRAQNPRRCLALDKLRKQVTPSPDQKRGNIGVITTPPGCPNSCVRPRAASSPPQGDRKGGRFWLTLPDVTENSIHCDLLKLVSSSPLI